ncbi:MAG: hypothetical protein ACW981_13840 [Candidatus Hodarchaeales archaeon]|jgi:hypothetical protein
MKKIKFSILYGCLLILTLFTVQLGHSETVSNNWVEDFENDLSNWSIYAYHTVEIGVYRFDPTFNYTIENGMATHPDMSSSSNDGPSFILHASNLAYGEWNIDYLMPSNVDEVYTIFQFIFNDFEEGYFDSFAGDSDNIFLQNVTGYVLVITGSVGAKRWYSQNATMLLIRIDPFKWSIENGTLLTSPWESANGILGTFNNFPNLSLPEKLNIKLIRTIDGSFKVFYNSELIIKAIDNTYNSSEYLILGSWAKPHYADNITVSETIQEPTTTDLRVIWSIIPMVIVYTIFRNRNIK